MILPNFQDPGTMFTEQQNRTLDGPEFYANHYRQPTLYSDVDMEDVLYLARRRVIEENLKSDFPLKVVIFQCLFLAVLAILAFVFQILQFVYQYQLYYVSSGFW